MGIRLLILVGFLVSLSACDRRFAPEDTLQAYVDALSRSQWVQITPRANESLHRLPDLRDRQLPLTEFDVGILDFLSLQQCDVGIVAGKRNSILGKVMPPSQRFVYELDIIRAIESCDQVDDALRSELNLVAQVKRQELPRAMFNALWAGEEAKAFFSLANGYLPMSPEASGFQPLLTTMADLQLIAANLEQLPRVTSTRFEGHQKVLLDSEYAGRLLYSIHHIGQYLNQVTESIAPLLGNHDICSAPWTFLRQQFDRHYIKVLQPYMARIQTVAYKVLPTLDELTMMPIGATSKEWIAFRRQFLLEDPESVWVFYQTASRSHAKTWSRLFQQCSR